jgi:hypothetical protein
MAKVIECLKARYDVQEVQLGTVYRWRPQGVLIECECGETVALTVSEATCEACGAEHTWLVRTDEAKRLPEEDEVLHPWRYSEDREDAGLPFWDVPPNFFSLEGEYMRTEDVELGMFVGVHRGAREPELRDRIGIVRQRFGNHSYSPFEVQFGKNEQLELLWAREFEESEEFYEHYG